MFKVSESNNYESRRPAPYTVAGCITAQDKTQNKPDANASATNYTCRLDGPEVLWTDAAYIPSKTEKSAAEKYCRTEYNLDVEARAKAAKSETKNNGTVAKR